MDLPTRKEDCKACGGRVGSYVGRVSQMFVRGRLLELDDRVWLLLTHQPLVQVHGLRVGATVAAIHVHFFKITSLVEIELLLAACCVSHVIVVCFSPFKYLYAGKWESQSSLSRCIESLSFLSTFWALQIIASLKQKFQGFYNHKEILGSMKNKGIAEKYITRLFKLGNFHNRDIFKEFFSHEKFCWLAESHSSNFLLQVPPIGNFCKQIQLLCEDLNSFFWKRQNKASERKDSACNCQEATSQKLDMNQDSGAMKRTFFRRVVSSKILGVNLLGFLQFSAVSRRLQLLDATGAIDVIIPDLNSIQCLQGACQVTTFDLVIEGYVKNFSTLNQGKTSLPLSWSNILRGTKFSMESSSSIALYACFTIKEASFLQVPRHLNHGANSSKGKKPQKDSFFEPSREDTHSFDILFIIHKYPLKSKLFGEAVSNSELSFSVEAIKIPYHVYILSEREVTAEIKKLVEVHDCSISCTLSILCRSRKENNIQHILSNVISMDRTGQDGYFHYNEFPSLLKEEHLAIESQMKRVLLQFTDQSIGYYEVIQIGQCYLVHPLLGSSTSVTLNAGTKFWSLAFYCYDDQEITAAGSSDLPLADAILKVPTACHDSFNSAIEKARTQLSHILSIREVLECGRSPGKWEHFTASGLLTGSLVSFRGIVESLQSYALPALPPDHCMCIKNKVSNFITHHTILLVKDLQNCQLVKMYCDCRDYPFPVGLEQGAVVTIYRALVQLSSLGDVILHCLPLTLIVVCTIQECSFLTDNRTLPISIAGLWAYDRLKKHEEPTSIHPIFNVRKDHLPSPKLVKIHCRVLAVERLVLEKEESLAWEMLASKTFDQAKGSELVEKRHFRVSFVSVTIDDGSGLAQCWATDETAACLLNLPTLTGQLKRPYASRVKALGDMHEKLNSLVNKYRIILLQNGNFQLDCPNDSFVIQGGKDVVLTLDEKRLMHLMVKRACHASPLHIVAEHQQNRGLDAKLCGVHLNSLDFDDLRSQKSWLLVRKAERIHYERHLEEVTGDLLLLLKQP